MTPARSCSTQLVRRRRVTQLRDVVNDFRLDAERAFETPNHRRDRRVPELPFPFHVSPFPFYRRHLHTRNPARHDAPELGKICRDVQREPVPRDPLLHVNSDARDLAAPAPGPHAGVTRVPLGGYPEVGERVDQCLLQGAEIPMEIRLVAGQVDDRVAPELAGAGEGRLTAPLDFEDVDAVATDD